MSKTDTDNLVYTGKDSQLTSFRHSDFQYSTLGMLIIYRLLNDRDLKIIVTSRGSTTGTGKTTLAILLARWIREIANDIFGQNREWKAETQSYVDLNSYFKGYKDAEPGDVLLMDEIEYSADRRRHMTNENVKLSQAWSILRYKNVVTIATLPATSMIDQRLMTLADVWINVMFPGRANTYYLTSNDFDFGGNDLILKRLKKHGKRESLLWNELEDDPDYNYLKQEKKDMGIPGLDDMQNIDEQDLKEKEREIKQKTAIELLKAKENDRVHLTQSEIGDIVGYSQQTITKLKRENLT